MRKIILFTVGIILGVLTALALPAAGQIPDPNGDWVGWPWVAGVCLAICALAISKLTSLLQLSWTENTRRISAMEVRINDIDKEHYDSGDIDDKFKQIVDLIEKLTVSQTEQSKTLIAIREKMIRLENRQPKNNGHS